MRHGRSHSIFFFFFSSVFFSLSPLCSFFVLSCFVFLSFPSACVLLLVFLLFLDSFFFFLFCFFFFLFLLPTIFIFFFGADRLPRLQAGRARSATATAFSCAVKMNYARIDRHSHR